jgi:hypothetical protein
MKNEDSSSANQAVRSTEKVVPWYSERGGTSSENLAADEPCVDSCPRRRDSRSDRLDNARG